MSIRNPKGLKEILSDPNRLARAFSRHTYGMAGVRIVFLAGHPEYHDM